MTIALKAALIAVLLGGAMACAQEGENAAPASISDADEDPFAEYSEWRAVDPENLLLIETVHGTTAIELNPAFAPNHVIRIRELVRAGFYDNEYFYRVIDGFVAQAGVQHDERMTDWPPLKHENERVWGAGGYTPLDNDDLFAYEVGHSAESFAMARDIGIGVEWLLHCPGAMAMARDVDRHSGATEFYIVLATQRYLDRNLAVFGRVIDGMQYVQKLERGDRAVASGVIQPPRTGDEILSATIASDLPEATRPTYEVLRAGSAAFEDAKTEKRVRDAPFFFRKPPQVLDVCAFDIPVRRAE